ncbi:MAG TPA: phosphoribosyltransferase family protein, partial [Chitinophagaceae bacterium]|nr:phosphoribosyltransferase family protein [Chitinophagaceae bacterium]
MAAIEKNYILSADAARKKMRRMAYEILENNTDVDHIIFLGIVDNGLILARAVASIVHEISGKTTEVVGVSLDKKHPSIVTTESAVDFNDKVVILVDDVTNSGKTLTYALKPILEAYPRK